MKVNSRPKQDEWRIIETLLPDGWQNKAWELGAFRRSRYGNDPGDVLRLLLFHAVNDGGLRSTVTEAKAAGIASMSAVGLFKRLRTSVPWLRWIALELCRPLRERPKAPANLRPRAIDSTTIQEPGSTTSNWRLHYSLDLLTLGCDWHELTNGRGAEGLQRTPVEPGDVLIGDRNYLRLKGIRPVVSGGGHVLIRMKWGHPRLENPEGDRIKALDLVGDLQAGQIGEWPVCVPSKDGKPIPARIIALKLSRPLAEAAIKRLKKRASKRQQALNPKSIQAAHFIFLFTTIPGTILDASGVADLYRFRWQVEIAFKRHKQLLALGQLPHKDPLAAEAWILLKLIVALLLETLLRQAESISPWGFSFDQLKGADAS